jgi:hypothetical protein
MRRALATAVAVAIAASAAWLVVPDGGGSDPRRGLQAPADDVVCCDGQPAYDSSNTDGQAESGTGAVAYRPGGVDARRVSRPDARLFRTGFGGWEPTLGLTRDGAIYYGARNSNVDPVPLRSDDGGRTWQAITPRVSGVRTHTTSLDPYLWVDRPTGRVFVSDLDPTVTCSPLSYTDDRGDSWTTTPECGETDHQSIFGGPAPAGGERPSGYPHVVYFCAISGGEGADSSTFSACSKSLDGGKLFTPTGDPAYPPRAAPPGSALPYCDGAHGHGVVDSAGTVYLPRAWCREPYLAISRDEGRSWERVKVADMQTPEDTEEASGVHESGVAVDGEGNAYYAFVAESHHPFLVVSHDGGRTWGAPMDVLPPGVTHVSAFTASIDVGAPGKLALVLVGTEDPPGTPEEETTWNGYVVTSADALKSRPTFYAAAVNDPAGNPLWRGRCGDIRCGNIGDFLDVVIGPEGTPWAALVDSCPGAENECEEFTVNTPRGEAILGRLVGGPSLR